VAVFGHAQRKCGQKFPEILSTVLQNEIDVAENNIDSRFHIRSGKSASCFSAADCGLVHLWSPYVIEQTVYIFSSCRLSFFLLFSSPNLSGRRLNVCHTFHTWCGFSANLECRSEMCCTRLAENTGTKTIAKKSPSGHHRTTL